MRVVEFPDVPTWLEARRRLVTASRAPIILGIAPWGSRYAEWAHAVGLAPSEEWGTDDERLWGSLLEGVLLERWRAKECRNARHTPRTLCYDDEFPWLAFSPDALTTDDPIEPVEIKTSDQFAASHWSEGVPLHYQVQAQVQMRVSGAKRVHVASLVGARKFTTYTVDRDEELIERMLPHLAAFADLIEKETPPAPDGRDATTAALRAAFPGNDDAEAMPLSEEVVAAHEQLADAKEALKAAELAKAEAENIIRAALGNATVGVLPDGSRYLYRVEKRKGYTKTMPPWEGRILRFSPAKEESKR